MTTRKAPCEFHGMHTWEEQALPEYWHATQRQIVHNAALRHASYYCPTPGDVFTYQPIGAVVASVENYRLRRNTKHVDSEAEEVIVLIATN